MSTDWQADSSQRIGELVTEEWLARHAEPVAAELLQHFPGLVIEGARQVGKSTLAAQIARPDAVVLNLDREQTRAAAIADPAGFVDQGGERQLVIDEVQRMPELTLAVKAAIDANRRPGRFVLTGSSSLLRGKGTADSLAGRVARLTLYGLSRGEAIGSNDDFANALIGRLDELARVRLDGRASRVRTTSRGRRLPGTARELRGHPSRVDRRVHPRHRRQGHGRAAP
ncbi:ATP-binding protein [Agromyces bauzanensis]|uniref:ATP-binding protein n=1 Tax=Agromyces bauzanensis TaxID=1308924 RepID=UPI001669189A|nr:AAA family ATPase [Agromyces bauzanensis]